MAALAVAVPVTAHAGDVVIVVDGDVSSDGCPGSGTEDEPYGSLECALASGTVVAGACIQLRDADSPYAGASTAGLVLPADVVIEAHPGHAAIIDGSLVLDGEQGWTVRDLVFDGSAGPPQQDAITVNGGSSITIEDVTILDYMGVGIYARNVESIAIRRVRVERAFGHAIYLFESNDAVVEDNAIAEVLCESTTFTLCHDCGPEACLGCGDCLDTPDADCLDLREDTVGAQIGMRIHETSNVELARNWIHDFGGTGCGVDATNSAAIFVTRPAGGPGRIHHNLVERINPDGGGNEVGGGILMFQGADGWRIDHNVVVDPGMCGLCEGNWVFHGAAAAIWEHNTVVGGRWSIDVIRAADATFYNNLVTAPVRVRDEGLDAPPLFDNTLHGSGVVGTWGADTDLDLASWQDVCACDGAAMAADPLLDVGYSPLAGSPALDLGRDRGDPFHGEAPDAGALEPPLLVRAVVPADAPTTVVVDLQNVTAPPLAVSSCGGLEVLVDDVPNTPVGCAEIGDQQIRIDLDGPIEGDQTVIVRPGRGGVRDSARIGNRLDAHLLAQELAAENNAPPGASSATSTGEPDTATDTDGEVPGSGEDAGCGCRCGRPRALWLLMLALGVLRRQARAARAVR